MSSDKVIHTVEQWLHDVVVGMELCPFAQRAIEQSSVRFVVCDANDSQGVLDTLQAECERLDNEDKIETTLIVVNQCLDKFDDYNDFLDWVDMLLFKGGWEGRYQVASFHPSYCFADVEPESAENLTNRSPYPILHILREESLEKALDSYPDPENIPTRNIAKVLSLTENEKQRLFPYLNSNS